MAAAGGVVGESEEPLDWTTIAERGGFTLVVSEEETFSIPLSLSTTFPSDANDSDAGQTAVMRGYAGSASAMAIVTDNRTHVLVNSPTGENYKVQFGGSNSEGTLSSVKRYQPFEGPLDAKQSQKSWNVPDSGWEAGGMVHVSPPGGGSIEFSKHIWDLTDWEAADPVNVIFYDGGWESRVVGVLETDGWTPKGDSWWCSSGKDVHIHDGMHGGRDEWFVEDEVLVKPDKCEGDRYHMRLYESESGDSHSPGFVDYSLTPVHWEEGTTHSYVDPQEGQDRVAADLVDDGDIGAIHSINVGTSSSECSSCDNWGGAVDLYQVYPVVEKEDPCGGAPNWYDFSEGDVVMLNLYC